MAGNQAAGDKGEKDVVRLVPCPNCGKKLMQLPKNYPMYDVQCTGCTFRAQVKTNNSKPKDEIFGAGWDIMAKTLKAGFMAPALLTNFAWVEGGRRHCEIRFYPFIPKDNLRKRATFIKKQERKLNMFNYVGIEKLPHFVVYTK